jgi:integrase
MDITKDMLFRQWQGSLKKSTGSTYKIGVIEFCNFTGKTPIQLIEEAREDYINRVAPWDVRHVKAIEGFIEFLKSQDRANWTRLSRINAVKNFYNFNKIPTFLLNSYISASASEKYLDLPALKIEDIRRFVTSCGTKSRLKALILSLISSGQAQAEILKLKGKHLNNVVNNICIVNMTRGKTNQRYTFFIGNEAREAIKDYKPNLKDEEYVFTQDDSEQPIYNQIVEGLFARHAVKLGYDRAYFAPHRFRHYFKTALTGIVDSIFVEYWLGHKPRGTDANYFIGSSIQDRMLEAYIKNLDRLTVFTDSEVLQKQYDELKGKVDVEKEELKARLHTIETKQANEIENLKAMIIAMSKAEKQKA